LWAALATCFTNLAAINVVFLVGGEGDPKAVAIASVVTSILVGVSVYAKERLNEAKEERERQKRGNGAPKAP